MKKIYLFSTRIIAFWVLIPLAILLYLSITHNSAQDNLLKLYPLILLTSGAIIFSLIYLFRVVKISYSEIKYIGYFSSRDSATIDEGKTLILEKERFGKVKIILFGNDGVLPGLDWMKNTYSAPKDIVLFRGSAIGGDFTVKRILKFFGAEKEVLEKFLTSDGICECEFTTIKSVTEEDSRIIKIVINQTV